MNEATVNITGVKREELIGSDFFDYFTTKYGKEVYEEVFFKWLCNRLSSYSLSQRRKLTDVLFNGSDKNDEGKVLGIVIVARDVTKQKQAALYTRSILEASSGPSCYYQCRRANY
jgi:PAS domain S-box-containing protein